MKKFTIIAYLGLVTITSLKAGFDAVNYDVTRPKRHTQKIRTLYNKYDKKKQYQDEQYRTEHFVITKNNNTNLMSVPEFRSSVTLVLIGISLMRPSGNLTF